MREYEILFIINPECEDDRLKEVIEKFTGIVTRNGGEILKVDEWGRQKLAYGDAKGALADFEAALVIPENIEVGSAIGLKKPQVLYSVGLAQQALGQKGLARKAFEEAAALRREAPEAAYYQGLALGALGRKAEARALFDELAARPAPDVGLLAGLGYDARREEAARVAREHTLRALGFAGRGEVDAARKELEAALAVAPSSLAARTTLASLAP